jgi:glutamate synthase (NADPH/NADH) large chain
MVELEEMDQLDVDFLSATLDRHREFTGSAVADHVLGDWVNEARRFRKVMPTDYKRVLTVMDKAKADGLDDEQTVERIMEAARV